ncbi:hypothetical protein BDF20DRAFT_917576 [Mycotypha africana]|uniref:uncharacterized protein n=1 Tax=Mycotypha africana TaxID=64632 RepID=UPI0023012626|nr:uncharacterized protein BDF20DRAFT_917576 [Mycotypha africana]KAI8967335.1 hypothetical protein BDF20DRAFT_917576 [Mycotypha africana]
MGRKTNPRQAPRIQRVRDKGKGKADHMEVNVIENGEDLGGSGEEGYYSSDSESDAYTSTASGADSENEYLGYESDGDDTVIDYPYDLETIKKSTPLRGTTIIHNRAINTIFDSGASVSLISRALAKELRLLPNGDTITVASLNSKQNGMQYGEIKKKSDITVNVPVRIGGKLRPEHMVISDECSDDTFLLGITWHKTYGIVTHYKDNILEVPTKNGRSIYVQASSTIDGMGEQAGVYTVSIRMAEEKENKVCGGERLLDYAEEIYLSEDEKAEDPEIIKILDYVKREYKDCFVENAGLGKVDPKYTHKIELIDKDKAVMSKPYTVTHKSVTMFYKIKQISNSNHYCT